MAGNIQKTRPMQLGRRLGGPIILAVAQLSKCILWILIGYAGFAFTVAYLAALELAIAVLLFNKSKMSWIIMVVACAVELVASSILAGLNLTQLSLNPSARLLLTATVSFSMVFIMSLFELVAAFTKEVRVHYLGGQPPPFKPTYAGPPPEPEF